jgi:hypothetical protein
LCWRLKWLESWIEDGFKNTCKQKRTKRIKFGLMRARLIFDPPLPNDLASCQCGDLFSVNTVIVQSRHGSYGMCNITAWWLCELLYLHACFKSQLAWMKSISYVIYVSFVFDVECEHVCFMSENYRICLVWD